jgi:hypothetical protein
MPQPKSSSGRKRRKRPSTPARTDESTTRGIASLRDLLARAVMLPTDLVRDALDDAVRRGRMTRADAEELAQSLIAAGRRQTEDVLADLEQILGRPRRATQNHDADAFPIADYDTLAAAQITSRLDDLSPAELRKVRDYERRHGNRKTVLSAIERKLA